MNESKAEKHRYLVMFLLDDVAIGGVFKPEALHLTIVTWFVTNVEEDVVMNAFYSFFTGQKVIDCMVGEKSEFNHKRKVLINRLEPASEIIGLHRLGLEFFDSLAGRWGVKNPHVADDYVPHIRRRPGHNLNEGDKLKISSVSLIRANRQEDGVRQVIAKAEFDENQAG